MHDVLGASQIDLPLSSASGFLSFFRLALPWPMFLLAVPTASGGSWPRSGLFVEDPKADAAQPSLCGTGRRPERRTQTGPAPCDKRANSGCCRGMLARNHSAFRRPRVAYPKPATPFAIRRASGGATFFDDLPIRRGMLKIQPDCLRRSPVAWLRRFANPTISAWI